MILVLFCRKLPTNAYHILGDRLYHINHIIRNRIVKNKKYFMVKMKFVAFFFCNTWKLEHCDQKSNHSILFCHPGINIRTFIEIRKKGLHQIGSSSCFTWWVLQPPCCTNMIWWNSRNYVSCEWIPNYNLHVYNPQITDHPNLKIGCWVKLELCTVMMFLISMNIKYHQKELEHHCNTILSMNNLDK